VNCCKCHIISAYVYIFCSSCQFLSHFLFYIRATLNIVVLDCKIVHAFHEFVSSCQNNFLPELICFCSDFSSWSPFLPAPASSALTMSRSSEKALSLLRFFPRLTLRSAEKMPTTRRVRRTIWQLTLLFYLNSCISIDACDSFSPILAPAASVTAATPTGWVTAAPRPRCGGPRSGSRWVTLPSTRRRPRNRPTTTDGSE
jgi:hypothetical protein